MTVRFGSLRVTQRLSVALGAVGQSPTQVHEGPGPTDTGRAVCIYSAPSSSPSEVTKAPARVVFRRIATMATITRANARSPRSKAVIDGPAVLDWLATRLTVVGPEDEPFPVPVPTPPELPE